MLSPSTNSSSNSKGLAGGLNLSAQTPFDKAAESNRNSGTNVSTFGTESVPVTSGGTNSSWAQVLAQLIQAEILSAYSGSMAVQQNATDATQTMTNPGTGQANLSGASSMDYWLTQILSGLGAQSSPGSAQADGQALADGLGTTGVPVAEGTAFAPQSSSAGIDSAVEQASATYGLPASLVRSVIQHESGFNSNAVSPVGAIGLMQLMPQTAQEMGVSNPYDPVQNVWGGTRYLAGLVNQFHGDLRLAVAAYNAGPGAVMEHGGVPPYPETQAYVTKVLGGAGLNTDTHSAT